MRSFLLAIADGNPPAVAPVGETWPWRPPKHRYWSWLLVLLLVLPTLAGGQQPVDPQMASALPPTTIAILFIGNSLTYANDLPALVERLLDDAGVDATVQSIAGPNYGLEDHWRSGNAKRAIASRSWDAVILQQGPSATEGRPSLLRYSRRFAPLIRESGATPALYMVWPSLARARDRDGVARSYRDAAKAVDGLLLPVGEAWRNAWHLDPSLEKQLYGADGFHPSPLGSYLAALVIAQRLSGLDAEHLPRLLSPDDPRSARLEALLRQAATPTSTESSR